MNDWEQVGGSLASAEQPLEPAALLLWLRLRLRGRGFRRGDRRCGFLGRGRFFFGDLGMVECLGLVEFGLCREPQHAIRALQNVAHWAPFAARSSWVRSYHDPPSSAWPSGLEERHHTAERSLTALEPPRKTSDFDFAIENLVDLPAQILNVNYVVREQQRVHDLVIGFGKHV